MSEKWTIESADTNEEKYRSHKLNMIETKMEIIMHAESSEAVASGGLSLDLASQLSIQL
jgi:hypothetical protein